MSRGCLICSGVELESDGLVFDVESSMEWNGTMTGLLNIYI